MSLALKLANLSLLVLFPIAWTAPLIRAGLLPLFGLDEVSILSGIAVLWEGEPLLAGVVAFFALVAPYAKTILLAGVQFGLLTDRALPLLTWAGKLAMADIFLIALYIVVVREIGIGRVEVAWGLYFFTFCVLFSLAISLATHALAKPEP